MSCQIFGLIVVIVSLICGTILIYKRMSIQEKKDQDRRQASEESINQIRSDRYRLLYEDEVARRELAETKLGITKRQLDLARETMAKIKVKEVTA